jgi:S1-C subfamily serine protease
MAFAQAGLTGAAPEHHVTAMATFMGTDGEEIKQEPGVLVGGIVEDGAFEAAGIARGDILLEIDGRAIDDHADLMTALSGAESGDELEMTVQHGDDKRTVTVEARDVDGRVSFGFVPAGPHGMIHAMRHLPGLGWSTVEVVPDSPAEAAGLEDGDRIVSVDGVQVDADHPLESLIGDRAPGETVELAVQRDDETLQFEVKLGEHPDAEGRAFLGVRAAGVESFMYGGFPGMHAMPGGPSMPGVPGVPGMRDHMPDLRGLMESVGSIEGAVVLEVEEGSPAEAAGLARGEVITSVDGQSVTTDGDLADSIGAKNPGDRVTLEVTGADGESRQVTVNLAPDADDESAPRLGIRYAFVSMQRAPMAQPESGARDGGMRFRLPMPVPDRTFEAPVPVPGVDTSA